MPSTISNNEIFEVIKKIKEQNVNIQNDITAIKIESTKQKERIEEFITKINKLEQDNQSIIKQLNVVESAIKNNNIIYGFKETNVKLLDHVIDFFAKTVRVNITEKEINNIYRIGKGEDKQKIKPIFLQLVSNLKKQEIFGNVKNLKGFGISISNDLNPEERKKQKILYKELKKARIAKKEAFIKNNKLVIDGKVLTYEDLKVSFEKEKITNKPSEEASTSTTQNKTADIEEGEESSESDIETDKESDAGKKEVKEDKLKTDKKRKKTVTSPKSKSRKINNIYRIGKGEDKQKIKPIFLQLVSNLKKQEIFGNVKNLKGFGISISNDLNPEERKKQKILYEELKKARIAKKEAFIKNNKLVIDGKVLTYEDLKVSFEKEKITNKPSEEASTSTTQNKTADIEEDIETDKESDAGKKEVKEDKLKTDKKRKKTVTSPKSKSRKFFKKNY
ncbi:unnamed protein product [Brassicogethes aeneus]|uniref:Uncharacterized protein n=1 Tax=Brassicogethes aeneus TaxID=1431903 RepID=A0A9P0FJQ2_BRAAE|nr:unnamed protein product [Brassicogethes aeneus]